MTEGFDSVVGSRGGRARDSLPGEIALARTPTGSGGST